MTQAQRTAMAFASPPDGPSAAASSSASAAAAADVAGALDFYGPSASQGSRAIVTVGTSAATASATAAGGHDDAYASGARKPALAAPVPRPQRSVSAGGAGVGASAGAARAKKPESNLVSAPAPPKRIRRAVSAASAGAVIKRQRPATSASAAPGSRQALESHQAEEQTAESGTAEADDDEMAVDGYEDEDHDEHQADDDEEAAGTLSRGFAASPVEEAVVYPSSVMAAITAALPALLSQQVHAAVASQKQAVVLVTVGAPSGLSIPAVVSSNMGLTSAAAAPQVTVEPCAFASLRELSNAAARASSRSRGLAWLGGASRFASSATASPISPAIAPVIAAAAANSPHGISSHLVYAEPQQQHGAPQSMDPRAAPAAPSAAGPLTLPFAADGEALVAFSEAGLGLPLPTTAPYGTGAHAGAPFRVGMVPASCSNVPQSQSASALMEPTCRVESYTALDASRHSATLNDRLSLLFPPSPAPGIAASAGAAVLPIGASVVFVPSTIQIPSTELFSGAARRLVATAAAQGIALSGASPALEALALSHAAADASIEPVASGLQAFAHTLRATTAALPIPFLPQGMTGTPIHVMIVAERPYAGADVAAASTSAVDDRDTPTAAPAANKRRRTDLAGGGAAATSASSAQLSATVAVVAAASALWTAALTALLLSPSLAPESAFGVRLRVASCTVKAVACTDASGPGPREYVLVELALTR